MGISHAGGQRWEVLGQASSSFFPFSRRFQQPQLAPFRHRLPAVIYPQFCIDLLRVPLHRTQRQAQAFRNLGIRAVGGQQRQDFQLAPGEGFYQLARFQHRLTSISPPISLD